MTDNNIQSPNNNSIQAIKIIVSNEDFNIDYEYRHLTKSSADCGAVVTFIGLVRADKDTDTNYKIDSLTLEHYPQMTEKALLEIAKQAFIRFNINAITIIHRVGKLLVGEQIVFVGTASSHRREAFLACEFLIDYLKTTAPFWKKEQAGEVLKWVSAKDSDESKKKQWEQDND